MSIKKLSVLIFEKILTENNKNELFKEKLSTMILPWLKYIDNMFDNISTSTGVKGVYKFIWKQYVKVLHDLHDSFPEICYDWESDPERDPVQTIKLLKYLKENLVEDDLICINYNKNRVIFKRDDKFYYLYTGDITDPILNDKLLKFFDEREIAIVPGIQIGSDFVPHENTEDEENGIENEEGNNII